MRAAMASAEVGDDVYREDPTVNRLEEMAADLCEKEAALFVTSGTLGNQLAVKLHTRPGDDAVIESRGHIYCYELGAAAAISGITFRPVINADGSGHLSVSEIRSELATGGTYYASRTGLLCLENSHNFAGGSVMSADECSERCQVARDAGIPVHMDGARIFNAAAALECDVADLVKDCDSVMFCLSKGLGAPVGSMLAGKREFIDEARVWRKRLGGGMRQAGILAAAGLIALDDGAKRLHDDHSNAKRLARGIAAIDGFSIDVDNVVTNIVIFDVAGSGRTAAEIVSQLAVYDIHAFSFGTSIRMVTHLNVTADDIETTIKCLSRIAV